MSSIPKLNPTVENGFASSTSYDKHRPTYVTDAVNYLLESLNVSERKNVKIVDMAAGTGKFTKILLTHPANFEVAAVEPHGEMSKVLTDNIAKWGYKNVKSYKGDVLEPGIEKHWADAIVIAQAFHWFATIPALQSLHALLAPPMHSQLPGRLGMLWNIEDYNQGPAYKCTTHWESLLRDHLWSLDDGVGTRYRDGNWVKVFQSSQIARYWKVPIVEKIFPVTAKLAPEDLWKRICTLSYVARLADEPKKLEDAKNRFEQILEEPDVARDDDGRIEFHYVVHVAWTTAVY